jgi:small subunit ribosomal protein S21
MIVVPLKEGENIERALKKFKRKFEKTGVVKELRERQAFIKPSVKKRNKKRKRSTFKKCSRTKNRRYRVSV